MNYKHSQATIAYAKEFLSLYGIARTIDNNSITSMHHICGLILENDKSLMSEATGIDNPFWEKRVVPILVNYLKDQPNQINLGRVMEDAIREYLSPMIQELFNRLTDEDN